MEDEYSKYDLEGDTDEGTSVLWFNGDVDHDHKITLTGQNRDSDTLPFDSDVFA